MPSFRVASHRPFRYACLAVTILLLAKPAPAQEILEQELWKLVAQSHFIVVGTPTVSVDQIQRPGEYVNIPVRVQNCLKGDPCPETTVVRYFTRSSSHNPAPSTLLESSGNQSVLFLIRVDTRTTTRAPEIYFAGYTPRALQAYSKKLVGRIGAEVLAQKQIIDQFSRNFRPEDEPSYSKVRSLIEAMVDRHTEKRAFTELEALGQDAVPAMVMLMDDRRELPINDISLRNTGPGNFETFRNYGPEVVADALDAILNQITGEDFGTIHNGASERERKAAIDGWRVHLHRKRFRMHERPVKTD